jgi:hypothetical protein
MGWHSRKMRVVWTLAVLVVACGGREAARSPGATETSQHSPRQLRTITTQESTDSRTQPDRSTAPPADTEMATAAPSDGALHARTLYDGLALGLVTALAADSQLIYVGNDDSDAPILILDTKSGASLAHLGREGDGPGEYRYISSIQSWPSKQESQGRGLIVFDGAARRLTRFRLLDPSTAKIDSLVTATVDAGGYVTGLAMLPDSSLIGPGLFTGHRLARLRLDGALIEMLGPTPANPDDLPVPVLEHVYQSTLAARPDGSGIALATRFMNHIELYDAHGSLRRVVEGPLPVAPVFHVAMAGGAPTMASDENLRFGYTGIAAGQRYIYALFSGRRRGDYAPSEATYADQLHVFDWDGNLVRTVKLGRDISIIAVAPDEKTLYGISVGETEALVAYDLDRVLATGP